LKQKRIAKIKSKIYRKIRKRRLEKDKIKLMAQLTPAERQREIEKMREERARERITLRHTTKNKYT
jgi:U3 small nucleolar RNA-associated protein 14